MSASAHRDYGTLMKPGMSRYEAESLIDGGRGQMAPMQFERIWIEQCAAARRVKSHFGLANALDYLVGEKLLNFAQAAEQYAEFAQELPDFLREIRDVFSVQETGDYAVQLECTRPLSPLQRHALRAISSASAHVH